MGQLREAPGSRCWEASLREHRAGLRALELDELSWLGRWQRGSREWYRHQRAIWTGMCNPEQPLRQEALALEASAERQEERMPLTPFLSPLPEGSLAVYQPSGRQAHC